MWKWSRAASNVDVWSVRRRRTYCSSPCDYPRQAPDVCRPLQKGFQQSCGLQTNRVDVSFFSSDGRTLNDVINPPHPDIHIVMAWLNIPLLPPLYPFRNNEPLHIWTSALCGVRHPPCCYLGYHILSIALSLNSLALHCHWIGTRSLQLSTWVVTLHEGIWWSGSTSGRRGGRIKVWTKLFLIEQMIIGNFFGLSSHIGESRLTCKWFIVRRLVFS